MLTCPCHLPILAIVLAGTTAGAFIGEHWGIAALTLTGLFVLSRDAAAAGLQGKITTASQPAESGSFELRYQSGGVPP